MFSFYSQMYDTGTNDQEEKQQIQVCNKTALDYFSFYSQMYDTVTNDQEEKQRIQVCNKTALDYAYEKGIIPVIERIKVCMYFVYRL